MGALFGDTEGCLMSRKRHATKEGGKLRPDTHAFSEAGQNGTIPVEAETRRFGLRELLTGQYVASYDPDIHAPGVPYPTGFVEFTDDCEGALHFTTMQEAAAFRSQRSTVTPNRPDGAPNRPLTVWTVRVEPLPSRPRGEHEPL